MCILPAEQPHASAAALLDGQARQHLAVAALSGVPDSQDNVATLLCWRQRDILAVAGPDRKTRRERVDFVVALLTQREGQCEQRICPVRVLPQNLAALLLAFAEQLDKDLAALAL